MANRYTYVILSLIILVSSACGRDRRGRVHYGVSDERETVSDEKNFSKSNIWSQEEFDLLVPAMPNHIPSQVLERLGYIASYNHETKNPNWVAWHLTKEHTDGPFPRLKNFHEEEEVKGIRASLEDYRGSGWSRGHMCPAGDNKWNEIAMYESFSLVNVCPQNANLNSGLWNSIENDCRRWANKYGSIYIVCGPIYLRREHVIIGKGNVVVPEAFFKVVLCLNGTPKAMGFIVRNTDGIKKNDLYYNSIDEVERITGYDFFSALPDDIEDTVEATADISAW